MQTINDRFRFILKEAGLSQKDFADRIKRSRGEIANIVYDKVTPKDKIIEAVCDEFNVDRGWLENGTGEPFREKTPEEHIADILGSVLTGSEQSKARLIRAVANLPDELTDAAIQVIRQIAESLQE